METLKAAISRLWCWVNGGPGQEEVLRADSCSTRGMSLAYIPVVSTMVPIETRCSDRWNYRRPY